MTYSLDTIKMQSIPLTTFQAFLYSFILFSYVTPTVEQDLLKSPNCNTSFNYTPISAYAINLDRTLRSLRAKAPFNNGFFKTSNGEHPDKVYGLLQCRGDIPSLLCEKCRNTSTDEILRGCNYQKEAVVYYKECWLRYAHYEFFSIPSCDLEDVIPSGNHTADPTFTPQKLKDFLINISLTAASSAKRFSTWNQSVGATTKVFGLAQCTGDLSKENCSACLSLMINTYMSNYSVGVVGGQVLSKSCNIKARPYQFYQSPSAVPSVSTESIPSPPSVLGPVSSPSPLPQWVSPPPEPSTQGKKNSSDGPESTLPAPTSNSSNSPQKPKDHHGKDINDKQNVMRDVIIGAAVGVGVTIVGVVLFSWVYFWRGRKETQKERKEIIINIQLNQLGRGSGIVSNTNSDGSQVKTEDVPLIYLEVVHAATNNFSDANKLGQGGFGPVYKGILGEGKAIAVKRLSESSVQGLREFKTEVKLISKLQHRNLVRLLGYCVEGGEKILIYEYMPNSSLDVFLFDPTKQAELDWKIRYTIITGIARGLMYLHEDSRLKVIHRDLKASNILLDNELNPKISDFGLARIFAKKQSEAITGRVVGTFGYIAPEYIRGGQFSMKSDVFSFGVLLLEIISGKKSSRFHHSELTQSLLTYAWELWREDKGLELVDTLLGDSCVTSEVLKCLYISLLCVQEDPTHRPTMSSVIVMLSSNSISFEQLGKPAFYEEQMTDPPVNDIKCSINEVTLSSLAAR